MAIDLKALENYFVINNKKIFSFDELLKNLAVKNSEYKELKRALYSLRDSGIIKIFQPKGKKTNCFQLQNRHAARQKMRNVNYLTDYEEILSVYDANKKLFVLMGAEHRGVNLKADKDNIKFENIVDGNVVMIEPVVGKNKEVLRGEVKHKVAEQIKGNEHTIDAILSGIDTVWPEKVLKEVANLKDFTEDDFKGRKDFRNLPFVTIDGEDSKDFDDAVHVEAWIDSKGDEQGFIVRIAIADVASVVKPNSSLDQHAQKLGNSTYLPNKVYPMFPERISNDLCSLNPNVDRPAMVTEVYINKQGEIQKHKFFNAVIKSKHRLTYAQVQKVMDADFTGDIDETMYHQIIEPLHKVYKLRRILREKRGALDINLPETYFNFNEVGSIKGFNLKYNNTANQLIEELMVLNNIIVGYTLSTYLGLYRVHEGPSQEKLENLFKELKSFGVDLPNGFNTENPTPLDFQKLITSIKGRDDEELLLSLILRSQSKAIYNPENIGHFGLGLKKYAHFTSPIRRYPDLLNHRLVKFICNMGCGAYDYTKDKLEEIGKSNTTSEQKSASCEKSCKLRMQIGYYQTYLNEYFDVTVSSISEFGVSVELPESNTQAYLAKQQLKDIGYVFDKETNSMVAKVGKLQPIKSGTKLVCQLTVANNISNSLVVIFESFANIYKLNDVA